MDSLPPPPNPNDLPPLTGSELTGSQLSLMSLPPPPSDSEDTNTIRRRKGNMTPTNVYSPDRTPTQGMSPDQTPTPSRITTPCFSPPHSIGSNCSTPTQVNSPVNFSPTHSNFSPTNGQYVNNGINHRHTTTSTLPTTPSSNFNTTNGLRSSLRQVSLPRQISMNSITSTNSSNSSGSGYALSQYGTDAKNSPSTQRRVNFQEPSSPKKQQTKKISFNIPEAPILLPKKPQPPKRSDSTKLSTSPKKLVDPPTEFLKDLQRVMRKKWQVAQKCKDEPSTTPHEVLGFRDPPTLLPDYKETNVSKWVKEHYGLNNYYENVYSNNGNVDADGDNVVEYATSPIHHSVKAKRPPPPPPKRSETTHLTNPKSTH